MPITAGFLIEKMRAYSGRLGVIVVDEDREVAGTIDRSRQTLVLRMAKQMKAPALFVNFQRDASIIRGSEKLTEVSDNTRMALQQAYGDTADVLWKGQANAFSGVITHSRNQRLIGKSLDTWLATNRPDTAPAAYQEGDNPQDEDLFDKPRFLAVVVLGTAVTMCVKQTICGSTIDPIYHQDWKNAGHDLWNVHGTKHPGYFDTGLTGRGVRTLTSLEVVHQNGNVVNDLGYNGPQLEVYARVTNWVRANPNAIPHGQIVIGR